MMYSFHLTHGPFLLPYFFQYLHRDCVKTIRSWATGVLNPFQKGSRAWYCHTKEIPTREIRDKQSPSLESSLVTLGGRCRIPKRHVYDASFAFRCNPVPGIGPMGIHGILSCLFIPSSYDKRSLKNNWIPYSPGGYFLTDDEAPTRRASVGWTLHLSSLEYPFSILLHFKIISFLCLIRWNLDLYK